MSRQRPVLITVAVVLILGSWIAVADAATTTATYYNGLPQYWFAAQQNCAPPNGSFSTPPRVLGPGTPSAGPASLKLTQAANQVAELGVGTSEVGPPLTEVTSFEADLYVPSTGGVTPQLTISAVDTTADIYQLTTTPAGTGTWIHPDAAIADLTWYLYRSTSRVRSTIGHGTLSAFEKAHPNLSFVAFDIAPNFTPASACIAGTYYVNEVHYAVGSDDKTFTFGIPTPTSLSNGPHPASILTGQTVTLSATLTHSGTAFAGQTVQLWARDASGSSHLVRSLTTDASGKVSIPVESATTNTYRWRYPSSGTNPYAPSASSSFMIVSHQRVAVTAAPATTTYRGTAVVSGRVTPHRAGVTVRLVRFISGHREVVAVARTGAGGSFTIKAPMTVRGTFAYVVTALPYPGEAAGQSAVFRMKTS